MEAPGAMSSKSMKNRGTLLKRAPSEATTVLALRPKDAAKALSIGERLLWTLTNREEIPHVRIGRAVLYPVDALREYLREKAHRSEGGQQ